MSIHDNTVIYNAKVVTESGVLENAYIRLRGGKISEIGSVQDEFKSEGPSGVRDELWDEVLGGTQEELHNEARIDAHQAGSSQALSMFMCMADSATIL